MHGQRKSSSTKRSPAPCPPRSPRARLEQLGAWSRIGFDLGRSLLFPVNAAGGSEGAPECRRREGAVDDRLPDELRLLSWNVYRNYRRPRLERELARLVAEHAPHVVLLQEVPVYEEGALWELEPLREALADFDLHYAPCHRVVRPTPYYDFAHSGLVTLARAPMRDVEVLRLPVASHPKLGSRHRIERLATCARLDTERGPLGLYHLHLENTAPPGGRWRQLAATLDLADRHGYERVVVAGDLNTFLGPLEGVGAELSRRGFRAAEEPRRWRLLPRLDHLFARGAARAHARRLPVGGSDHRPLLVDVEL